MSYAVEQAELIAPPAVPQSVVGLMDRHEAQLTRVARLLHDDVNQILSAAGLHLDILRMEFHSQAPNIGEKTGEIQVLLGEAIERLRKISHEINPDIIGRVGLNFALEQLVSHAREGTGAQIRLRLDPRLRLPKPIAQAFYKVAGAALDNAVRHAEGPVELTLQGKASSATLEVRDYGSGFDPMNPPRRGLGLALMEYYASQIQADLRIESAGDGTKINIQATSWE